MVDYPRMPKSGFVKDKWKLDSLNEDSVMGSHFASAVIMVASGNADAVIRKKKAYPPCKKIFWEEPRFNAALENTNNNYAFDAHVIEERNHWKKSGKKFVGGSRFAPPRNFNGPLAPEEFEHCFEKPVPVFERSVVLHPFERAKQYNKPRDRSVPNPEKAYHDMRTSLIGPSTYTLPDLWEGSAADENLQVNGAGQSFFKSATPRFKDRKSNHVEFPVEKEGTSIPHSRGRSRGGGFRETRRPVTEGEISSKLAAASISTWQSFQEAPSGMELSPVDPAALAEQAINSTVSASDFFRVSSTNTRGRGFSHSASTSGMENLALSRGVIDPDAMMRRQSPHRAVRRGTAPGSGDEISASSSAQRQQLQSRVPGFTILSKDSMAPQTAPNHSKTYRRVILPDGTAAILPVTAGAAGMSSPLQLSKSVSFDRDARAASSSSLHSAHGGSLEESMSSILQVSNQSTGPQVRPVSPPEISPSSLSHKYIYDNLRGMTPPANRTPMPTAVPPAGARPAATSITRSGEIMDDESSVGSLNHPTARESDAGSSYSKAIMQKWVPPVYYSSKNKTPVPDIGAIPYQQKRHTAASVLRTANNFTGSCLGGEGSFTQSSLDELSPVQRPASKSFAALIKRPPSSGDDHPLLSKGYVGGMSGERTRQDSIGAVPLPVGTPNLRNTASRGSETVLNAVQEK